LASASYDEKVIVWDASTGAQQHTLEGHSDRVNAVQFSRDGSKLASASWDKKVIVWDASTGAQQHTLEGHSDRVNAVQFSPDGSKLASASYDKKVIVWDASTGAQQHTLEGHSDWVNAVQFSRDGSKLASASFDKKIIVWDLNIGSLLESFDTETLVSDLEFSSNGFFLNTDVGSFALQAGRRGPSGDETVISHLQTLGCFWHPCQTIWLPPGHLFLERAVAAHGPKIPLDHSSSAIHAGEDDHQYGPDEIESPSDPSTTPLLSGTSDEDDRTSSLQLQGDWIHRQNHRIIWLPPELRPVNHVTAVRGEVMVIGHSAGNISFWEAGDSLKTYPKLYR
jgi:WD40 repeat protein